jgi:hypothetical protein
MVMDLLEGKSLHDELNNHKSGFPLEICRMIMLVPIHLMVAIDERHRVYAQLGYHAPGPKTREPYATAQKRSKLPQNCRFWASNFPAL